MDPMEYNGFRAWKDHESEDLKKMYKHQLEEWSKKDDAHKIAKNYLMWCIDIWEKMAQHLQEFFIREGNKDDRN